MSVDEILKKNKKKITSHLSKNGILTLNKFKNFFLIYLIKDQDQLILFA